MEPRYTLIDSETGRSIPFTTDEIQAAFFLAQRKLNEVTTDGRSPDDDLPPVRGLHVD